MLTQDLVIKGVSGGSGQYAWKKLSKLNVNKTGNLTVSFYLNYSNIQDGNFSLVNLSTSYLTESDFYGIELFSETQWNDKFTIKAVLDSNHSITCYWDPNNAGWEVMNVPTTFTWSYSNSSGFFSVSGTTSGWFYSTFSGSTTVTKNVQSEIKEGYVVSDDSSAYPNNATHTDGYYYTQIS